MNVASELEIRFPNYRSSELESEWLELQRCFELGQLINGKISLKTGFGVFVEFGKQFPAILLITNIKEDFSAIEEGNTISANIYVFDAIKRQIGITQKGYEDVLPPLKWTPSHN